MEPVSVTEQAGSRTQALWQNILGTPRLPVLDTTLVLDSGPNTALSTFRQVPKALEAQGPVTQVSLSCLAWKCPL